LKEVKRELKQSGTFAEYFRQALVAAHKDDRLTLRDSVVTRWWSVLSKQLFFICVRVCLLHNCRRPRTALFESVEKVGAEVLRDAIERYARHKSGRQKLPQCLQEALITWVPEANAWDTLKELIAFLKPLEKHHAALTVVCIATQLSFLFC
jgi:hypothetical protein